jgi:hypothetical protein
MAVPNEVKFNVRRNALLLKTFTVPQLESITGLNRQSIYTEVRRMEGEKLLVRVGTEAKKKGSLGGRPSVVYQLTPDPEKRFEILQSVRAFYAAEDQTSELARPESKHYYIAKEELESVAASQGRLTEIEKMALLPSIWERLEYARREEEVGEEATELIAASFDVLEAKAVDMLAGDWERAIVLLDEARRVGQRLEADDVVTEVQAYVQTIARRMAEEQVELDESGTYEKVEEIAQNLRIIKHRFGDLPEISTLVKQADRLAARARQELIQKMALQEVQIADARARAQTKLITYMGAKAPEYGEISERHLELGLPQAGRPFAPSQYVPHFGERSWEASEPFAWQYPTSLQRQVSKSV